MKHENQRETLIEDISRYLFEKNFTLEIQNEHILSYNSKQCEIEVFFGRYSEEPDISVRFFNSSLSKPEHYSIGSIQFYDNIEKQQDNILKNVKGITRIRVIFEFLKCNYHNIIDIEYCRMMERKITDRLNSL